MRKMTDLLKWWEIWKIKLKLFLWMVKTIFNRLDTLNNQLLKPQMEDFDI